MQAMTGETTMTDSEADQLVQAKREMAKAIEDRKVIEQLVMERKTGASAFTSPTIVWNTPGNVWKGLAIDSSGQIEATQ
jgi:hypothetical protein